MPASARPYDVAIVGASGYTGTLCAEQCVRAGLSVLLVGRNAKKLLVLAAQLGGLPTAEFVAGNVESLAQVLVQARVVLACAGPFSSVGLPIVNAAMRARCTYLDISGELPFVRQIQTMQLQAEQAGVALIPCAGFDSVIGETAAVLAAQQLQQPIAAVRLSVATTTQPSRGSLQTLWAGLGHGDYDFAWRANALQAQSVASIDWRTLLPVPFGPVRVAALGLVELATASRALACAQVQTGIAFPLPRALWLAAAAARWLHGPGWLRKPLLTLINAALGRLGAGGSASRRAASRTAVLAEVTNGAGHQAACTVNAGDISALTASCAALCVQLAMREPPKPGVWTPTQAFGADALRTGLLPSGALFSLHNGQLPSLR